MCRSSFADPAIRRSVQPPAVVPAIGNSVQRDMKSPIPCGSGLQPCTRACWPWRHASILLHKERHPGPRRRCASALAHTEQHPGPRRRAQRSPGTCTCQSTSAADAYPLPDGELGVSEDLGTFVYKATLHRLPTESSIEGSQYSMSVDSEPDEQLGAPPPEEKGMSHRWRVTWFMGLAFLICNMDKVLPLSAVPSVP